MPRFTLRVNGESHAVEAPPDMPLLWVLRDLIGLTGTKYGCGVAQCGSCTVHLDGRAVRSCVTPVADVGGAQVTTIEGLAADAPGATGDDPRGGLHPLQRAWIEEDVPQCGYCQPGQVMSAAALLSETPAPSDADIDRALEGNICRCGTYGRIRKAIHRAAGEAATARRGAGGGGR